MDVSSAVCKHVVPAFVDIMGRGKHRAVAGEIRSGYLII